MEEKGAPLCREMTGGHIKKIACLSTGPSLPPALLCAAKHIYPPLSRGGGPRALHYTTGLHPEKRRVSCKVHFEATF